MLHIQNKCPYELYRDGSRALVAFKMECFVTIVKRPVNLLIQKYLRYCMDATSVYRACLG